MTLFYVPHAKETKRILHLYDLYLPAVLTIVIQMRRISRARNDIETIKETFLKKYLSLHSLHYLQPSLRFGVFITASLRIKRDRRQES